jgi:chromosome segregation ATPase
MTNKEKKDRIVLIEQPYEAGWMLTEPKEAYERTESMVRYRVLVPGSQTVAQTVRLEKTSDTGIRLVDAKLDDIRRQLGWRNVVTPAVKEALEKLLAMRLELERIAADRGKLEAEAKGPAEEQGRVRENLKTIQQGTDIYQRQLAKFDKLETQIEQLRGRIAELRREEEKKRSELANYISTLKVE